MFFLFFPTGIIVLTIIHFSYKADAISQTRIFGVIIAPESKEDSEIISLIKSYKKNLSVAYILLTLFFAVGFFVSDYISLLITLFFIFIFGTIGCYTIIFTLYGKKIINIRAEKGYIVPKSQEINIDTEVARLKSSFPLSKLYFIPPIILYLAIMIIFYNDFTNQILPIIVFILAPISSLIIYFATSSARSEIVSENSDINIAINKAYKRSQSKIAVFSCYLAMLFIPLYLLSGNITNTLYFVVFVITISLFSALNILYVLSTVKNYRKTRDRLQNQDDKMIIVDDEEFYKFGVYYNPNDKKVFVPKSIGYGSTINFATVPGKIFVAVFVVILYFIISVVISTYGYDFGIISLSKEADSYQINSPGYQMSFDIEELVSVELVGEVNTTNRINGAATSSMRVGYFRVSDIGNCKVYLMNDTENAVKIKLSNDEIIFINGESEELTILYYEMLLSEMI